MGLLIHVYMFTFINFKQNVKINCQWKKKVTQQRIIFIFKVLSRFIFSSMAITILFAFIVNFPRSKRRVWYWIRCNQWVVWRKKGSQIKGGHRQPRHVNLAGNSGLSFPLTRYIPRKYWRDSPENMQTRVRLSCIFILRSSTLQIKGFY